QDHSGYTTAVLARAAELGLKRGEDLLLLGTVPDESMAEWYWSADAFVFPSVKEGWGLAVLEAMAAGLPVITSDIPVFKEYLHADDAVCVVRAADSGSPARPMPTVVPDPPPRHPPASGGPDL